MANPLFQAAASSVKFASRRAALRRFGDHIELETIIIDVDRTLTLEDSPKLALEKLVGREKSKKIFDSFFNSVLLGRLKLSEIHGAVFGTLYSLGFKKTDWVLIMEDLERNGGLRKDLIESFVSVAKKGNLTTVLATRASFDSAQWLAKRFGFDYAVGSVEMVNGVFQGFETMIGASDNGNGTMTKISAASKALAKDGKSLDLSKTAVIANDLLDALEMLNSARGIVILPSEPNRLEKLTAALRLYDVLLCGDNASAGLSRALGL